MPAETTLLPEGFKVLVDAPDDHIAEEWCWVPVAFAATEQDAIALAKAENVLAGADLYLISHGREWWRRDPAYTKTDDGRWRNDEGDVTTYYEPWLPCSKFAESGIEVWRLEVTDDPNGPA